MYRLDDQAVIDACKKCNDIYGLLLAMVAMTVQHRIAVTALARDQCYAAGIIGVQIQCPDLCRTLHVVNVLFENAWLDNGRQNELKVAVCNELTVHWFFGLARKFDQLPNIKDQEHLRPAYGSEVPMVLRWLQLLAASES